MTIRTATRCALGGAVALALALAAGCNSQAPPMTKQEQQNFQGHAPANLGQIMRDTQQNFHGRPSGGQQPGNNGAPGGPPPGAVPSAPPAGGGAPK